jgi:hypothetical protein
VVVAGGLAQPDDDIQLLRDRHPTGGRAVAFVCRGYVCGLPTQDGDELTQQLRDAARSPAT